VMSFYLTRHISINKMETTQVLMEMNWMFPLHESSTRIMLQRIILNTFRLRYSLATVPLAQKAPEELRSTTHMSTNAKLLDSGAALMQRKHPIHFHQHLCGFHFVNGDMSRQVEAHHFCQHINEDFLQCVIYDSNEEGAKLIGVEYVISQVMFEKLPVEEKKFWHSHSYEVISGQLVLPGIPTVVENRVVEKLAPTYGKTFHFWQIDKGDTLPLGPPTLMMGFTADGQIKPEIVKRRDEKLGIDTAKKRAKRKDISSYKVLPGANHWEYEMAQQLAMKSVIKSNQRLQVEPQENPNRMSLEV